MVERVEQIQDDRDQRLQMALECLDASEEQRREESTMLRMRLDDLASRNQELEVKVRHLEGEYSTLTDQVRFWCRSLLMRT